MTPRIPLNFPCIFKDRLLESTGGPNKADSNYHAIVWRPIGGVTDAQIELLHFQFLEDLGLKMEQDFSVNEDNRVAERGMFTIEGSERERHVHIALILTNRAETIQTSSRYKELLGKSALLNACSINGVKIKKHIALKCVQPKTDLMKNYKQTTWLAYTAKEAAVNPDFTIEDCNNGNTRRMKFVFDELKGQELKSAQTRFMTAAKTFWHQKLVKKKIIYFTKDSMDKLANEFYPIHCPDLPWCPENRAYVLARMYLYKGRYLSYDFAANFFKEKYIHERFALHSQDEDFPSQVVKAIRDTFDIVENGGRPLSTQTIKKLNHTLDQARLTCRRHEAEMVSVQDKHKKAIQKLKEENNNLVQQHHKDKRMELELFQLKQELSKRKAEKRKADAELTETPAAKMQRITSTAPPHICDFCEDCPVNDRKICPHNPNKTYQ